MTRLTIFFTVLFVFAISCKTNKRSSDDVIDFEKLHSIDASFDDASSMLMVNIKLDPSLHAYADGEKIGRPVKLEIIEKNGWAALGKAKVPNGQTKNLGIKESVVLEGEFGIRQQLKKGINQGEALLHLQVCTKNACDRPRIHKLNFQ